MGAIRSIQGSGKGVPLSQVRSWSAGSYEAKIENLRGNKREKREEKGKEKGSGAKFYRLVGDDVLAEGEAHARARPEGGGGGSGRHAVAAHDARRDAAQSPGHFSLASFSPC